VKLEYLPIVALNRTYALSMVKGKEEAIIEAEKLNLTGSGIYFKLLGELYTGIDNKKQNKTFKKPACPDSFSGEYTCPAGAVASFLNINDSINHANQRFRLFVIRSCQSGKSL